MSLTIQNRDSTLKSSSDMGNTATKDFWRQAFAIHGSITPHVFPNVLLIGLVTALFCVAEAIIERFFNIRLALAIAPYELIGAALGLLLVLRTNSGYDRWWEARKLWGGIVNQSRNMVITGLSYGPESTDWRNQFVAWACVFPYAAMASLRAEPLSHDVAKLIGEEAYQKLSAAEHMPSQVALTLAQLLQESRQNLGMDNFAFLQADKERAMLVDHVGGCERILNTPLALAYSIKIRRFIAVFLITLPFALIHVLDNVWLVPIVTMLVAYPLFSLDQLGVELQNPFSTNNLSHLPLDQISRTIEHNLRGIQNAPLTMMS